MNLIKIGNENDKNLSEEAGISVMVAIIILIGLSMLLAASIISLIPEATPRDSISPSLGLHYEENTLTLSHQGGGDIPNSFVLENGEIAWKDLEIRKNGEKVNINSVDQANLNGDNEIGLVTYTSGDKLNFKLQLEKNDRLSVVYSPTNQVLLSVEI